MSTKEEYLENEIRTLNHHIQSMIDTMKVMSMNKQDMSDEIERLKSEIETAVKAEREACAKLCDENTNPNADKYAPVSQYEGGCYITAEYLAAAIRARGQG